MLVLKVCFKEQKVKLHIKLDLLKTFKYLLAYLSKEVFFYKFLLAYKILQLGWFCIQVYCSKMQTIEFQE